MTVTAAPHHVSKRPSGVRGLIKMARWRCHNNVAQKLRGAQTVWSRRQTSIDMGDRSDNNITNRENHNTNRTQEHSHRTNTQIPLSWSI